MLKYVLSGFAESEHSAETEESCSTEARRTPAVAVAIAGTVAAVCKVVPPSTPS